MNYKYSTKLNGTDLAAIYELKKQGKSLKQITLEFDKVTFGAIYAVTKLIETALATGKYPQSQDETRNEFFRRLTQRSEAERPVGQEPQRDVAQALEVLQDNAVVEDNLTRLTNAFETFQSELIDIVDDEATRRTATKVKEAEKKLEDQRVHYEKELEKLQAIIVQMQDSSVVGVLKKKWGLQ